MITLLPYQIKRIQNALTYTLAHDEENLSMDDVIIMWELIGIMAEQYKEIT